MAHSEWVVKEILVKKSFTKGLGKVTKDSGTVSQEAITALGLKKQGDRNCYLMRVRERKKRKKWEGEA